MIEHAPCENQSGPGVRCSAWFGGRSPSGPPASATPQLRTRTRHATVADPAAGPPSRSQPRRAGRTRIGPATAFSSSDASRTTKLSGGGGRAGVAPAKTTPPPVSAAAPGSASPSLARPAPGTPPGRSASATPPGRTPIAPAPVWFYSLKPNYYLVCAPAPIRLSCNRNQPRSRTASQPPPTSDPTGPATPRSHHRPTSVDAALPWSAVASRLTRPPGGPGTPPRPG